MNATSPANPLAAYADYELLELISMRIEDTETANLAFTEFYNRFKDRVAGAIFRICAGYSNNVQLGLDLLNNTFINAYLYAGSFSIGTETDPIKIGKKIAGWLFAIAKRELTAMYDDSRKKKTILRELYPKGSDIQKEQEVYADAVMNKARASPKKDNYRTEMVTKAIKQIPKERDREIYNMYWLTYTPNPGGKAKKLPDKYAEVLAQKYSTTPENVRKIVSRCNERVKKYLDENLKP